MSQTGGPAPLGDSSSCHTGHAAQQVDSGWIFPLAGGLCAVHRLAVAPHIRKKEETPLAVPAEYTKNQLLSTPPWPLSPASPYASCLIHQHSLPEICLEFSCCSPPPLLKPGLRRVIFPQTSLVFSVLASLDYRYGTSTPTHSPTHSPTPTTRAYNAYTQVPATHAHPPIPQPLLRTAARLKTQAGSVTGPPNPSAHHSP